MDAFAQIVEPVPTGTNGDHKIHTIKAYHRGDDWLVTCKTILAGQERWFSHHQAASFEANARRVLRSYAKAHGMTIKADELHICE